jgi:hypothetical protein
VLLIFWEETDGIEKGTRRFSSFEIEVKRRLAEDMPLDAAETAW